MTIQRVVTFLNRDEVDFLDKLGKDALFSTGCKLSRAKLISWLIDFTKKLDLSGENIHSEEDFENRILSASHGTLVDNQNNPHLPR
ncbi:MAG: hypothetical protein WCL25_06005 [bacterium]